MLHRDVTYVTYRDVSSTHIKRSRTELQMNFFRGINTNNEFN